MFDRMVGGFRRALALMMSIFIILSQLALPAAALAQTVEALPSLNLYYTVGENTMGVNVMPTLYAQQPIYWAMVPAEAMQSGVTLEILPTGVEGESYNSSYGFQLMAQDAGAVDGMTIATYIEVYRDGAFTSSYPLYISTQPLPEEGPAYFEPVGVEVRFLDQDGNVLNSYSDSVGMEGKTFYAESFDGYDLTSSGEVWVSMDETGRLSQTVIEFWYAKKSFEPVGVEVRFLDQDGNVLNSYSDSVGMDGKTFYAESFDGYDLTSSGEVYVSMDENGNLSQTVIEFWYAKKSFEPVGVEVRFLDQDGNVLNSYADNVGMEGKTFYAESFDGYDLTSAGEVYVSMDGNGNLSQTVIEFWYAKKSFEPVGVEVRFLDQDGNVLNSYADSVGMDGKTFYAESFDGYDLTSAGEVYVSMDENGQLSQTVIEFWYAKKAPDAVTVEVRFIDQDGNIFSSYSDSVDMDGKTFYAENFEGYTLTSAAEVTVSMDGDGNLSQNVIEFYYSKNAEPEPPVEPEQPEEPKAVTITMKVVDSADWDNVFYLSANDYTEGSYTFDPKAAELPENYTLDNEEPVVVNVYADGTADFYEVLFTATYHAPVQPEPEQPEEPKFATITMKVVDSANHEKVFFSNTDEYGEGAHTFDPKAAELPENYTLDSSEAVTVNVYADGTADLYDIVFTATYHAPVQPEPEQPVEPEQPEEPDQPEPEQPVEPEQPEQPESGLPEGVTLIENLSCEGETTKGSLRFRSSPSIASDKNIVVSGVKKGVIVQVTASVENEKGELWYSIIHEGTACYVRGDCLKLIEKEPVSEKVTFLYQDENGNTLMDAVEETFTEGSYPTAPYQKEAPGGYAFSGVNTDTIIVDENGVNTATVIFTYAAVEKEPVAVNFTFDYVCGGQPIIDAVTQTLGVGSYPVSDYVRTFEGYTFVGASQETLVVNEDGSSSNTTITFDYNQNPVLADVTIHHKLADGSDVPGLASETKTLEKNTYDVKQFIQYAEGYSFVSASAENVVVDENGANPAEVTLTYQKDVVQAEITVHILDTDGKTIHPSYPLTLGEGTHAVSEIQPGDPEGYSYSGASHDQITVTAAGADPSSITFYYQLIPVEAQVSFHFVDEQGNPVPGLDSYSTTLGENTYDTAAYAIAAPAGYQYNGASAAQIVVNRGGASPAEVFFYYTRLPESVSIPVYHQDADGKPLMDATSLSFGTADFGSTVNVLDVLSISAPEGYVYAGLNSDTITIDQRGGVTPEAIQVTYVVRPKAEAEVTFYYLCDGKNVADPLTVKLSEGTWDTNEYAVKVDGYDLVNVDAQTVTITEDGKAAPAEVNFIFEKRVTTANLTVHYRNSFGEELPGSPEIRPLEKGTHNITPNAAYVPAGYVLSTNTQVFEVTVNDDLTLSTPSVSFNYYDENLTGTVTVNYYDTESGTTFATEEVKLAPGTHELKPNETLVASKGNYEVSDMLTNSVVRVDEKGAATPSAVVFYYKPATYQGYQGYLLTTQQTAIRQTAAANGSIQSLLPKDTVLWTSFQYQSGAIEWYDAQTMTGESYRGWVEGGHVRRISAEEAQILIEEANQPEELEQNPGYYITIMNNVPLRQYKSTASQAKYLNINTVVQVTGQEYDDNNEHVWHASTYYDYTNKVKYSGYIRDGQLRKMTEKEVEEYLKANDPVKPEEPTNPYDPNGPSSYGYVTKDSVNFRSEPGGTRIKMLNKYGMALIIGTREVNGVTWYNVNYSGQVGWIHGDYFHQMTLTEFTSFMGSEAYYQGITNNTVTSSGSSSNTSKPSSGNTGSATQGNVSSVEDWNVGVWQNTGATTQTTYQPFNPYATPVPTTSPKGTYTVDSADVKFHQMASDNSSSVTLPKDAEITIAGTVQANGKTWYQVTYDGRNGYVDASAVLDQLSATPTPEPTSTFVIGTMIPITYEDQSTETQSGTVPWGLIGGAIVLVGGAGGVYAYALNQNKKRKAAAARAAASRRAAAAAAAGATSPYARRAVAAAPNAQQPQQRPAQPAQPNQYARSAQQPVNAAQPSPYARPQQPVSGQQPVSPAQSAPAVQPQAPVNPYARPAQPAPIVNPYAAAAATEAVKADEPKPAANPYARPIAPVSQQAAQNSAQSASSDRPQRRTRMQRYHDAGGSEE